MRGGGTCQGERFRTRNAKPAPFGAGLQQRAHVADGRRRFQEADAPAPPMTEPRSTFTPGPMVDETAMR